MSTPAAQLTALLTAEYGTLCTLETALEEEYNALLAADVSVLEAATEAKNAAVQAHRHQQGERVAWMHGLDLAADSSLTEVNTRCGDDPANQALQTQLASLAARCQESNRRNGGLIIRLHERTRGALDVLRRDDSGPDLYSLSGSREHSSDGRSLGKA